MASGGTTNSGASNPFRSQQNTQQPQQNTQQNNPQSGFGFGPNQFGPQVPQQTGQFNAPLMGGSSYGFGPQQFGPQPQNPFGMTNTTIAAPQTPFAPQPQSQPSLSDAIGQLKSGNQSDAQNMLRQIIGLPPIQAAPYNPNPGLSDAFGMMAAGNPFGAEVRARVPAPISTGPAQPRLSVPAARPIAPPSPQPPERPVEFLRKGGRV